LAKSRRFTLDVACLRRRGYLGLRVAQVPHEIIDAPQAENGPERLVCEAELAFTDGPLAEMKLVGFSILARRRLRGSFWQVAQAGGCGNLGLIDLTRTPMIDPNWTRIGPKLATVSLQVVD
jgi:hypothetical protein